MIIVWNISLKQPKYGPKSDDFPISVLYFFLPFLFDFLVPSTSYSYKILAAVGGWAAQPCAWAAGGGDGDTGAGP